MPVCLSPFFSIISSRPHQSLSFGRSADGSFPVVHPEYACSFCGVQASLQGWETAIKPRRPGDDEDDGHGKVHPSHPIPEHLYL